MDIPTAQRHNLAAFSARLAPWGVCKDFICLCGLWIFRDTLEVPRPLISIKNNDGYGDDCQVPISDLLPAVVAWFLYCGKKLESLAIANQKFGYSLYGSLARHAGITPQRGFSVSSWIFWRDRLEEISRSDHEETAALALRGLKLMKFWGARIEAAEAKENTASTAENIIPSES